MNEEMIKRIYAEAYYMLETKKTIREIAKENNISKSTVHKDLSDRLYDVDLNLYDNIRPILDEHIEERHIRGGMSTREKYLRLKRG